MENTQEQFDEFLKLFKRVRSNPIYFIDMYYNAVHPDNKIELTDEEKQELFDKYRGIPLIKSFDQYKKIQERDEKLRSEGYKDWEIY